MQERQGDAMKRIVDLMKDKLQVDIGKFSGEFLVDTAMRRMEHRKLDGIDTYIRLLEEEDSELQALLDSLYVSWSEFFREAVTFSTLNKAILPEIIHRKAQGQEIRIWSIGCAKGQEPYSMAILLDDLLANIGKTLSVRIFATDLSHSSIASAKKGQYTRAEIQNIPLRFIDAYFDQEGEVYSLCEKIKSQVSFSYYDIFDQETTCPPESIYGEFDLIFCRNLLIYYNKPAQRSIVKKIKLSLAKEGYLVTGEAEKTSVESFSSLKRYTITTAILSN